VSFGHGFTIGNSAYGYIPSALVPTGYIVVMPSTEGGIPNHANFGADLAFVLRAVRADTAFSAALGPKSAIGGHSMGGGAAFLGAAAVPNLDALFAMAPAETNPKASAAATRITTPTMVVTGTRDCVTPYAQHAGLIVAALATPDASTYDLPLTGANHCQFTTGSFTCSTGQTSCGGSATISAAQQQTLTMNALKPFLDLTLKGR
jgi:dienelactone hydrolase